MRCASRGGGSGNFGERWPIGLGYRAPSSHTRSFARSWAVDPGAVIPALSFSIGCDFGVARDSRHRLQGQHRCQMGGRTARPLCAPRSADPWADIQRPPVLVQATGESLGRPPGDRISRHLAGGSKTRSRIWESAELPMAPPCHDPHLVPKAAATTGETAVLLLRMWIGRGDLERGVASALAAAPRVDALLGRRLISECMRHAGPQRALELLREMESRPDFDVPDARLYDALVSDLARPRVSGHTSFCGGLLIRRGPSPSEVDEKGVGRGLAKAWRSGALATLLCQCALVGESMVTRLARGSSERGSFESQPAYWQTRLNPSLLGQA